VKNPRVLQVMSGSGVAFRYREGTDPDLAPVVLLHGLSQQGDFWYPTIDVLGSRYSTLSIDLRGHGESRNMAPKYHIPQVGQDCIELMNELGIDSACVVGHSWGASVALNIAVQYPSRTQSCVLIDGGAFTPANIVESGSITRADLTTALTPPVGPFTEEELKAHYLPAPMNVSIDQQGSIMSAIRRSYVEESPGGFVTTIGFDRHMAVLEAFLDYNPDSDLRALAAPSWILMARDSFAPSATSTLDSWAEARNQVETKVQGKMNIALQHWYGAVHDVPLYWPIRVAQLISHAVLSSQTTPRLTSEQDGKGGLA
jgi:pimeloyl-ACP methyl ester carboxylesterase